MNLKVYTSKGVFSREKAIEGMPHFEDDKGVRALRDAILAYQANQRQGNASTKTRGEVSGTGKKPWKQKGTGMARHGSRRSPIWPGGGVAFGPRPTDYTKKVNKKVKRLALSRALFELAKEGGLFLIESLEASEPKTRLFAPVVESIFPSSGKVLIVDDEFSDNVILAGRNLGNVFMGDTSSVNAWDLVRFQKVLMTERALETLLSRLNQEISKE
jgi:large subunit ribosomal protein L4